jgi:ATP-binding cassette subfamily F protein uup
MAPRNLVNLKDVAKGYGSRSVLRDVTLGVAAGDRIGIVGRNGDGKSTLLRVVAGVEEVDAGALTRTRDAGVALLGQADDLDPARTVRQELVGGRADH